MEAQSASNTTSIASPCLCWGLTGLPGSQTRCHRSSLQRGASCRPGRAGPAGVRAAHSSTALHRGRRNPLTPILIASAMFLALYKPLKARGAPAEK